MFDLTSLYDDDVITDDVYIFVSALYATFEFNRTIGGNIEPTSLDLTTLSTDKLFKSIYSKEIKQAVADDNLLYMVYKSYGFLTSIIVFLSEMLLMLVMLVLSLAYLVIFVSVCLSCMLSDDLKLKDAFKRILSYLLIITVFQVVVDCIIIFTGDMINLVDNRISVGLMSLVVLIICLCIFLWVVRVFLGLLRNITSFGGDVVGDLVYGFVKNLNTQLYEIKKGVLTSCNIALHSPIHLTRNKEATNQSHSNSTKDMNIIELRRKININKMMKRK
jgi:hypothetical protein